MDKEIEVTVDGISYPYSALNDAARTQLANLQFVDGEIARLQAQLAVYQTARIAYNNALNDLLPRSRQ